jgi:catechol 2,3-dioxygenase-like lactoylglutathione lyase family enzyme
VATIDHVTLRASDLAHARRLFTHVFELLGFAGERYERGGFCEWNDFSISQADPQHGPTQGLHVAFAAASRAQVDDWWRALTAAGYQDDGAPGLRPEYSPDYYGAFIRDQDNNSIEAVHHESATAETGVIDHLWIRVADLAPTKRFYTAITPTLGLEPRDRGHRLQLIAETGTFTLLAGPPTQNLHLAIGVGDQQTVRDFHHAGLMAGGQDNGAPGERPQYHPGYYGAYLLDPDSNNIEAVFHDRTVTSMKATS